jgi:hypothetical protein
MVELKGLLKVYSKFRGEDSDSLANVIQLLAECALILLTRYRYHHSVFHSVAHRIHLNELSKPGSLAGSTIILHFCLSVICLKKCAPSLIHF